jgi:hypothetical protein
MTKEDPLLDELLGALRNPDVPLGEAERSARHAVRLWMGVGVPGHGAMAATPVLVLDQFAWLGEIPNDTPGKTASRT